MARATWILGIGGIVGLFVQMGAAQDRSDTNRSYLFDKPVQRRSFQYFPRNGRNESSTGLSDVDDAASGNRPRETRSSSSGEAGTRTPSRFIRRPEVDSLPPAGSPPRGASSPALPDADTDSRASNSNGRFSESGTSPDGSGSRWSEQRQSYLDSLLRQSGGEGLSNEASSSDAQQDQRGREKQTSHQEESAENGAQGLQAEPPDASSALSNASPLIHAEYQRPDGTSEREQIRQIRSDERNTLPLPRANAGPTQETGSAPIDRSFPSTDQRQAGDAASASSSAPARGSARSRSPKTISGADAEMSPPVVTAEWVKASPINVGQECECRLIVGNSGSSAAQQVVVDAYFPNSVRLTRADPQPIEKQGHLSWQLDSLAPGDERIIRVHMIPSRRGELATNAKVRFTEEAFRVFTVEEPLLSVKLNGPKQVMLGDPASQTVLVSNPGTGVATNVAIEAEIPKGLEHARGNRLLMEIGSLGPGESRMVRLGLAAVEGGKHPLTMKVTADAGLQKKLDSTIEVVAPSVKLAMQGPKLRYSGRSARYTITVTNDGAAASNNVRLVHEIPEGFEFIRADHGGEYDELEKAASWFVGRLKPGESRQVAVELAATRLGSFRHQARAMSEHGANAQAEFETKIAGTASLVLEVVDVDDPVETGRETAYEVRVRNEGSKEARTVAVTCEVPSQVELLDAAGPADFVANEGRVEFKALGTLPPGKTAIYRVQVRGQSSGNRRFRARLTSDSIQQPLTVDEMTKFYGE